MVTSLEKSKAVKAVGPGLKYKTRSIMEKLAVESAVKHLCREPLRGLGSSQVQSTSRVQEEQWRPQ